MLTGKAKTEFEKWLYEKHKVYTRDIYPQESDKLGEICILALYIDFFDSVGICASIEKLLVPDAFDCRVVHNLATTYFLGEFPSRSEATKAAILKANEIFNEKHG